MSNSNSNVGGNDVPSTNPPSTSTTPTRTPSTVQQSPQRRSRGDDTPHRSPQGRGSSPGRGSPQRSPSSMGVPGHSAFSPFRRHRQPQWPSPGPSGSGGPGSAGGVAQAVPVGGGSPGGVAALGALQIGGSPAARKRVREGATEGAGAVGGNPPGDAAASCSVCGKMFPTPKALFGHMRSHPDRGWKGAHPPPVFRAEEEFADLHVQNPEAGEAPDGREAETAGGGAEQEDADRAQYRVPDLNNPPPEGSD